MKSLTRALMVSAALIAGTTLAVAQGGAPGVKPTFDVASVKVSKLDFFGGGPYVFPGGRVRVIAGTLRLLMSVAYSYDWGGPLLPYEIVGGPAWLDSARFDVEAQAEVTTPTDPAWLVRLQSLLEDRFKVRTHTETRELGVFALVPARDDRRLGPQIRHSALECAGAQPGLAPAPPTSAADDRRCGLTMLAGRLTGRGVELSALATRLASPALAARWVLERTGLTGRFDFELQWTPTVLNAPAPDAAGAAAAPTDPDSPALFTALQEQLGLKLQSARGSVKVLIVDAVAMPEDN